MVRISLILLPCILHASPSVNTNVDYQLGDQRKVISPWLNSGITTVLNEILTIARIKQDGGTRFTRADGSSIWASNQQVNDKTVPHYEPSFSFNSTHTGMWVFIKQNIPTQNLVQSQTLQIIYIGAGGTGAQLSNGSWIGNSGKDLQWEFTEEGVFNFTQSMVGALIMGKGSPFVPDQHYVISEYINPLEAVTHDGVVVRADQFMLTWLVRAWFNTSSLPDEIKVIPDNEILQDMEQEWQIVKALTIINGEATEVKTPVYVNPQGTVHALLYFEQDSIEGETYHWDFGGSDGVQVRKSTWYFSLRPSNAYGEGHPYYRAGLLLGKVLNNEGGSGGAMRHDPRGQYAVEFYLPATGGGWTANHFGGWIEVTSPDLDIPPANPITSDQFQNEYKGWLVEKNYIAEIPIVFLEQGNEDRSAWSRQDLANWYKSQYNYMQVSWGQDWLYENMGAKWLTGSNAFITRTPDPHIMNIKVIYNIKSAESSDFYWVNPVQMFVTGGVMNKGTIKSGDYLIQIEDFELKWVADHGSTTSIYNTGLVQVGSGDPALINIDNTGYKTYTGKIVQTREPLNKIIDLQGFNEQGDKYYQGTWSEWINVRTKYAVYNADTGLRASTSMFDFDKWTLAHENFTITNK